MPTLAIDEHERVIGCEAAEIRRAHDRGRIADGLRIDVVGRHDVPSSF
jgi:hypothetical protein